MTQSRLVKSSLGTFLTRILMAVMEFLGIFYIASEAGASVLGKYALFVAVVVVLTLLTDLGIDEATRKRISEGTDVGRVFSAAFLSKVGLSVPVVLGLVAFHDPIASYIGSRAALPFLFLILLTGVVYRTVDSGLHGEKKVARAGFVEFVFSGFRTMLWIAFLSLGYGLFGLLLGYWLAQIAAVVLGWHLLSTTLRRPSRSQFSRLFSFAQYSWVGSIKETSWLWTDTLVLGLFVVPNLVGVYELSWQVSGVFFFAASAISATLFANVSEMAANGERRAVASILEESLIYAGIVAIPGLAGSVLLARNVLAVFGSEYVVGSVVMVILLVARVTHSYAVVFGKVISALDRPDLMLRVNGAFIAINVAGNFATITAFGWQGAAVATTLAMLCKTALTYRYISSLLQLSIPKWEIGLEFIAAASMTVVLWVIVPNSPLGVLRTVLYVAVGGVVYALFVVLFVRRVRLRLYQLTDSNA